MYFGSGGLLIVLGILSILFVNVTLGIVLIVLGILAGGWGFYGSRRAL